jgi:hypothetical protein
MLDLSRIASAMGPLFLAQMETDKIQFWGKNIIHWKKNSSRFPTIFFLWENRHGSQVK